LERDGEDIVPPSFQRYVDQDAVNFIENICDWIVFEGINRTIVSCLHKLLPARRKLKKYVCLP